ncbi:MAG TPA: pseudouridine synthase [Chitinophagales bacterium]
MSRDTTKTGKKPHPFKNFIKEVPFPEMPKNAPKKRFSKPKPGAEKENSGSSLEQRIQKHIQALDVDSKHSAKDPAKISFNDPIRLNKYLAHAGIASRRKADELISEGKVKVNGVVVTEMGHKVMPKDKVTFDNKTLNPEQKIYVLLNKPKDCITTTADERGRMTVLDLIKDVYNQIKSVKKPRLYPVGRLDRNTTGVLLITNDGELAQNLTHPSREIRKIYHVHLDKKISSEDMAKIKHGVVLEDGIAEVDEVAYANPKDKAELGIEIHNGKNRIVRRIFESLGYEVIKLDRVYFGGLTKKELPRGRWRFLEEEEIRRLRHFKLA